MNAQFARRLLATILGVAASSAAAAATGADGSAFPPPSAPLAGIVVDATGAPMGPYFPGPGVLISLGGRPVLLPVLPASADADPDTMLPDGNSGSVFFETTDCTGTAWLPHAQTAGLAGAAILANGREGAIVYMSASGPKAMARIKSVLSNGPHRRPVCGRDNDSGRMHRVDQVIDLTGVFVAPYRVQ